MEPLTKPRRVRDGDTVAVVGLNVRLMPHAARTDGQASAPPEGRVADLHADPMLTLPVGVTAQLAADPPAAP